MGDDREGHQDDRRKPIHREDVSQQRKTCPLSSPDEHINRHGGSADKGERVAEKAVWSDCYVAEPDDCRSENGNDDPTEDARSHAIPEQEVRDQRDEEGVRADKDDGGRDGRHRQRRDPRVEVDGERSPRGCEKRPIGWSELAPLDSRGSDREWGQ